MTKYDCSSADINPIGGINKSDIKKFLIYCSEKMDLPVLREVAGAVPSAELRPYNKNDSNTLQSDEKEMGFTYDELD